MGMFDDIRVLLPLPGGSTTTEFQTKSLSNFLEQYEIREDGTLWREDYDTEDHSDPNAKGLLRFAGMMARVNQRWVQVTDFTGEIEFHEWHSDRGEMEAYSTYWVNGELKSPPVKVDH